MQYSINNTTTYHLEEMETLGWELTVCNSLEPEHTPIRPLLKHNTTFGNLLCVFLQQYIDFENIKTVMEIGGGYGYIMRDILTHYKNIAATMLDISPFLLAKQQNTLIEFSVEYIHQDFLTIDQTFLKKFDLVILNENVGDFPTLCNVTKNMLTNTNDVTLLRIADLVKKYNLTLPKEDVPFNINTGAIEALELLCQSQVKHIFISEHSCEARTPSEFKDKITILPQENPERIRLKGHDEYTIRFSHLENVAKKCGYSVTRGNFMDFIEIEQSPALHYILTSHSTKDEHEIIRHFVEDLIKYEYILLEK